MKALAKLGSLFIGVFLLLAFTSAGAFGQTILDEELRDGALPDGWSQTEIDFRTSADGYALFETLSSELVSSSFDLSTVTEATLTFQVAKFGSGDDGPLTVEVSTDGGTTWDAQTYTSPTPTSSTYLEGVMEFDASVVGEADVMIRFTRPDSPTAKRLRDVLVQGPDSGLEPPVDVATIADLRAGGTDGTRYRLTGEALVHFSDSFQGRRMLVDGTAGIWSVDFDNNMDGGTDIGDGITGLVGTLNVVNNGGLLRFELDEGSADATVTSTGNDIVPETTTITDLSLDDTGKLVRIEDVDFQGTGEFSTGTNYTLQDGATNELTFRTDYFGADYIGEQIPEGSFTVVGVVGGFGSNPQIFARSGADFHIEFDPFELSSPADQAVLTVEGDPDAEVSIMWTETGSVVPVTYMFHLDAAGGNFSDPVLSVPSNNEGTANELTLTMSAIDQLLENNGVEVGQTFNGTWTVNAHASVYGETSAAPFDINLERGDVDYDEIGWANLQWPETIEIESGQTETVYTQVYAEGVTEGEEANERITAWIGVHDEDVDPADWPEGAWQDATFNESKGNNDEYMADIGETTPGTYYYASRFQLDANDPVYGGFDGGFWDGVDNVSGVMTVVPVEVENLAQLREGEIGGPVYHVSNEVILHFNSEFRGRKVVMDETAGIVFDDNGGVIESDYFRYDGISGITGTLGVFNGLLQFQPTEDPGQASSSNNTLYPVKLDLTEVDFEADISPLTGQLVLLENVTIQEADGVAVFENQSNYTIEDSEGNTIVMRTDRLDPGSDEAIYYPGEEAYLGTVIPEGPVNMVGYLGQFFDLQITPRLLSDINPADEVGAFSLQSPADDATVEVDGEWFEEVTISWEAAESEDAVSYNWIATTPDLLFSLPALDFASDDDGATNTLTVNKATLDGILEDLGVDVGQDLTVKWTVVASAGDNLKYANEEYTVTFSRGTVTSTENEDVLPREVTLSQNFPNPFNPTTQIEFTVPNTSHVTLKVYDMLGREVQTLVNEQMNAGAHTFTWDASRFASGMYIYRLQAANTVITRKMTLMK